jgi:hypothetical protein
MKEFGNAPLPYDDPECAPRGWHGSTFDSEHHRKRFWIDCLHPLGVGPIPMPRRLRWIVSVEVFIGDVSAGTSRATLVPNEPGWYQLRVVDQSGTGQGLVIAAITIPLPILLTDSDVNGSEMERGVSHTFQVETGSYRLYRLFAVCPWRQIGL